MVLRGSFVDIREYMFVVASGVMLEEGRIQSNRMHYLRCLDPSMGWRCLLSRFMLRKAVRVRSVCVHPPVVGQFAAKCGRILPFALTLFPLDIYMSGPYTRVYGVIWHGLKIERASGPI